MLPLAGLNQVLEQGSEYSKQGARPTVTGLYWREDITTNSSKLERFDYQAGDRSKGSPLLSIFPSIF